MFIAKLLSIVGKTQGFDFVLSFMEEKELEMIKDFVGNRLKVD